MGVKILQGGDLLTRLETHLTATEQVSVAVAWATPCEAVRVLLEFGRGNKGALRAIIGLNENVSNPLTLRDFERDADLKLTYGLSGGIFHPKIYLFNIKGRWIAWIGSANLTNRGFGFNDEAVCEIDPGDQAHRWFERLWGSLNNDSGKRLDEYEIQWKPRGRSQRPARTATRRGPIRDHPEDLITGRSNLGWNDFVAALRKVDTWWRSQEAGFGVLGDEFCYMNTIMSGREILSRPSWGNLSSHEAEVILGHKDDQATAYGLLGSMRGAGLAKHVFLEATPRNLETREEIRVEIEAFHDARLSDIPRVAERTIVRLQGLGSRIGPGVATRLMALRCPDRAISVNRASCKGLGRLSGLSPTTLAQPENYAKLLQWLAGQRWYVASRPNDSLERSIWSMRAALLDAFVYRPA